MVEQLEETSTASKVSFFFKPFFFNLFNLKLLNNCSCKLENGGWLVLKKIHQIAQCEDSPCAV